MISNHFSIHASQKEKDNRFYCVSSIISSARNGWVWLLKSLQHSLKDSSSRVDSNLTWVKTKLWGS